MAVDTISLTFNGYWRSEAIGGIPNESGVYVVYDGVPDSSTNTVSLRQVLYIGESERVRDRIRDHERWPEWRKNLGLGGGLYFSFAPISVATRNRAEAALIYERKPPLNIEYTNEFPFDATTVKLAGEVYLLKTYFVLYRTSKSTVTDSRD